MKSTRRTRRELKCSRPEPKASGCFWSPIASVQENWSPVGFRRNRMFRVLSNLLNQRQALPLIPITIERQRQSSRVPQTRRRKLGGDNLNDNLADSLMDCPPGLAWQSSLHKAAARRIAGALAGGATAASLAWRHRATRRGWWRLPSGTTHFRLQLFSVSRSWY